MAKSIGTLKASLVLDSNGFLQGFQKSTAAAKTFANTMATSVARGVRAATASISVFTKAAQLAKKAFFSLARDFAELSSSNGAMYATKIAFENLVKELNSIKLSGLTEIAEPLTAAFEKLHSMIISVKSELTGLGLEFQDLHNAARYSLSNITAALNITVQNIETLISGFMALQHAMTGNTADAKIALEAFKRNFVESAGAWKTFFQSLGGDTSGLGFPANPFVTPPSTAVEAARASSPASRAAAEPFRLSPLEMGTQEAASAIIRMQGGTKNTMSKEGVATIEQLKKIEANTRKRGAVLKEGRI